MFLCSQNAYKNPQRNPGADLLLTFFPQLFQQLLIFLQYLFTGRNIVGNIFSTLLRSEAARKQPFLSWTYDGVTLDNINAPPACNSPRTKIYPLIVLIGQNKAGTVQLSLKCMFVDNRTSTRPLQRTKRMFDNMFITWYTFLGAALVALARDSETGTPLCGSCAASFSCMSNISPCFSVLSKIH